MHHPGATDITIDTARRPAVATAAPGHERIHRVTSTDGTAIAGRVRGTGPPVVFLPAGPGDSLTSWETTVTALSDRFTCYLMDTRGRGLSADAPDHSLEHLVADVVAFADGIGEPCSLVGWGTSLWAWVAAEQAAPVDAVIAYEPGADEVMDEHLGEGFTGVLERVGSLAADGQLIEAAEALIEGSNLIYTDDELAGGIPAHFWTTSAPNIPAFLQEMSHASATAPDVLEQIDAPVLLLHGSESKPWFRTSVQYVAEHLATPQVREISGAGHFGPITDADAVAAEIARFLEQRVHSSSAH
jgi:pimeloyl-ACP methyl ester carboxylesterase